MFLSPESPRWLIDRGRYEHGLKVLAQLHSGGDESDPWVLAEYEHIKQSLTQERDQQAKVHISPDLSLYRIFNSLSSLIWNYSNTSPLSDGCFWLLLSRRRDR